MGKIIASGTIHSTLSPHLSFFLPFTKTDQFFNNAEIRPTNFSRCNNELYIVRYIYFSWLFSSRIPLLYVNALREKERKRKRERERELTDRRQEEFNRPIVRSVRCDGRRFVIFIIQRTALSSVFISVSLAHFSFSLTCYLCFISFSRLSQQYVGPGVLFLLAAFREQAGENGVLFHPSDDAWFAIRIPPFLSFSLIPQTLVVAVRSSV